MSGSSRRPRRAPRRLRATLAAALTAAAALAAVGPAASPAAAVTVSCGVAPSVPMYHVDGLGQLRRWNHSAPLDGPPDWTEQLVGSGWSGLQIASGGSGVLYTIDSNGDLRWYRDTATDGRTAASWAPGSGSVIGTGWDGFAAVVAGDSGVIYAVDYAGSLHWYRYLASDGSASWAPTSGTVIGTGWDVFPTIAAGGSGIIYAVDRSGGLNWYRQTDPLEGSASWANGGSGSAIGSGWSGFTHLGSLGAGILLAGDGSGRMSWYRHLDPVAGSASWANGGLPVSQGVGWNDSDIVGDVGGCVAS